jgi:glycosyltransferase involved in cell wall biosynthesis
VPTLIWADHPHPHERSWVFANLRLMYLRFFSRRAVAFLACGTPTVEHLATLGIPRAKIFNFPYWVDVPTGWSAQPGVPEENPASKPLRLLAIGRLVSMKGFDVAIKAVSLADQNADRRVAELSIIGDGPERESLEQLVDSLGIASSVTFKGRLDNSTVCEHLREADAVIVPSTFEPYGVVVLEALAHGRPVLASDQVIAALDRADESGAIRLHRVGDVKQLAAQIRMLTDDRTVLREASDAAHKIAELWKPERAAQMLKGILNERLGREITSDHDPQKLYQPNAQPTSNAS